MSSNQLSTQLRCIYSMLSYIIPALHFFFYRRSSWMQTPQQQSHSCHFANRKIYEPEEAAEAVCHLSWAIFGHICVQHLATFCCMIKPWPMYCRFFKLLSFIQMLGKYHCQTHMLCVAVWGFCWICIASYALGKWRYMQVVWKPLSILTPLSLVQKCLYLHSVHFVPCCSLHLCWELCCLRISLGLSKSFFSILHCWIILGVNVSHAVCFLCKLDFCKKWLNDCFSCFYLFYTIKFIMCTISLWKILCL